MKPWICYNRKNGSFLYCCFLALEKNLTNMSIILFSPEDTAKCGCSGNLLYFFEVENMISIFPD